MTRRIVACIPPGVVIRTTDRSPKPTPETTTPPITKQKKECSSMYGIEILLNWIITTLNVTFGDLPSTRISISPNDLGCTLTCVRPGSEEHVDHVPDAIINDFLEQYAYQFEESVDMTFTDVSYGLSVLLNGSPTTAVAHAGDADERIRCTATMGTHDGSWPVLSKVEKVYITKVVSAIINNIELGDIKDATDVVLSIYQPDENSPIMLGATIKFGDDLSKVRNIVKPLEEYTDSVNTRDSLLANATILSWWFRAPKSGMHLYFDPRIGTPVRRLRVYGNDDNDVVVLDHIVTGG